MKSRGESRSPCLSPGACLKLSPSCPFTRALDVEVARREAIQYLHFVLNPSAVRTCNKKLHPIESNAFEMS
jgi:hypothetical protein